MAGALIAAAQISTRSGLHAGRSCREATVTSQFLPAADRDALATLLIDADARKAPGALGELAKLAGLRYLLFHTADTAAVGLIRCGPHGCYVQTTLNLSWTSGDWKLTARPARRWSSATTNLTGLTGTVPWGAQYV